LQYQTVNYSCSLTNSCIRVTALLEYLDLQSGAGASCIHYASHYAIVAAVFAAQLALNYPSFADACVTIRMYINLLSRINLQLELRAPFWSCEAP